MIKSIILNIAIGKCDDQSPFIIADNENLIFSFISPVQLSDCIVEIKNGSVYSKQRIENLSTLTIPKEFYVCGDLQIVISLISKGTTVRKWSVEPIEIKECIGGFEAYAKIARINEVAEQWEANAQKYLELATGLSQRLDEAYNRIKSLEEAVEC